MRKIVHLAALLILISIVHVPGTGYAMVDPEIIQWGSADADDFVNSLYQATFGRNPNQNDREHASRFNGKLEMFMSLIDSREYQETFGYLERGFFVYWKKQFLDTDESEGFCNCYYPAENSDGFAPNIQFTGVTLPPGKQNFPVARALSIMCATFDDETCQLFECGLAYGDGIGEAGFSGQGGNLVLDPEFSVFGSPNGPWGCDGAGIWWGQAKCTVGTVSLDSDLAETALYIVNKTAKRSSHYGTTGQRISVLEGHTYEISFYAQARGLASRGAINIAIDPLWNIRPIKMDGGTYPWTKFSGTFVAPAAEIELRILCEDQGEAWITGMTLIER